MATQYITLADGTRIPVEGVKDYDSGTDWDYEGALNNAGYISVPGNVDYLNRTYGKNFSSPEEYLQWVYGGGGVENVTGDGGFSGTYFKTPNGVANTVNTPLDYNEYTSRDRIIDGVKMAGTALAGAGLTGALPGTTSVFGGAGGAGLVDVGGQMIDLSGYLTGVDSFAGGAGALSSLTEGGGMWDDIISLMSDSDEFIDIQGMIDSGALTLDDVDNFGLWDAIKTGAGGLWDNAGSIWNTITKGSKILGGTGGLSPLDLLLLGGGLIEGRNTDPTVTTQTATSTVPDWYTQASQNLLNKAGALEPSTGWQPYLDKATGYTDAAAGGLPSIDLNTYMNPYLDSVLDPMRDRYVTDRAQTLQGIDNKAASVNAFGRNRADLLKTQAGESADRTWNETEARIRSGAFDTAASNATRDLDRRATAGKTYGDYAKAFGDLDMTSNLLPITAYSTALKGIQLPRNQTQTTTTTNPPPSLIGQAIGGLGALSNL